MNAATFLDADELVTLTGRRWKAQQIDALREMRIPFFVNAAGKPVVVRAIIEGRAAPTDAKPTTWQPRARHGKTADAQ